MNAQRALRAIVDCADLLLVDGIPWLLLPASSGLLDVLATFEAELEDLEDDPLEDNNDAEPDECPSVPSWSHHDQRRLTSGRVLDEFDVAKGDTWHSE